MSTNKSVKRGDIYYIDIPHATGHEMEKDRPAIIVSCEALNDTSPCVIAVFCSASSRAELPEHVTIRSTPKKSTAMCEHIYTVDKSRVGSYLGRCTPSELSRVELGIMAGISLDYGALQDPQRATLEETSDKCRTQIVQEYEKRALCAEEKLARLENQTGNNATHVIRVETERDTYKELYKELLGKMTRHRKESA